MKRLIPVILLALLAAAYFTRSFWLPTGKDAQLYLGYVEAETTLISAPLAGRLADLSVRRGQTVEKDAALFSLDQTAADAEVGRVSALLRQALAEFANLETGKRKEEQDVVRAQRREAEAALRYAESDLNRVAVLVPTGATSRSRFDQATSQVSQLREKIASLRAQEAAGDLGGRSAERDAAEAKIKENEAALVQARKARADNAPVAPVAARIDDTYFEPGEWIPAGTAVVSLLAADRIKLRFFAPQERVSQLVPGTKVKFRCDGCATGQEAVVNFVASRAEFTPPVIYSADSRSKLVFLIEAKPLHPSDALRPGLPVEVEPADGAAPMTPAIDVHGLVKRYGNRTVVDNVDLTLMPGRICGFLGPNGSGKTTTLRLICGLLTPDAGSGTCLGYDLMRESAAIKRQTGYMTQKFGLYEDLTIRENLSFVARIYDIDNREERVAAALERLGLATRQDQLTGSLSGGWKQRLALAACVLHEPKLLLLDEPTAGVDPKARRAFWDEIHAYAAGGMTVLVSTHYMDEAERCHEIAYIAYGELMARGTADEIIKQSQLKAWVATGPGADRLAPKLRDVPGVTAAAAFGSTLHVCGPDADLLKAAVAPYRDKTGLKWQEAEPTLEDVFIHLMGQARDNALAA